MNQFKLIKKEMKTRNTYLLRTERPSYAIRAGQCFNLGLSTLDINREYSMYSDANAPYLEFLIRKVEGGLVSSRLSELIEGDYIEIDGPYGEFCINPETLDKKFIFIGTGTGIAPFHSFVKSYPDIDYKILHGIRYRDEQYDSFDYGAGRYIPCISRDDQSAGQRVTNYLINNPLSRESHVFICGNRNMIIEVVEILLGQGMSSDQIVTEVFF